MPLNLYKNGVTYPKDLFSMCGLTNITGFRYIARLKKLGFVRTQYNTNYYITNEGTAFLENIIHQIQY